MVKYGATAARSSASVTAFGVFHRAAAPGAHYYALVFADGSFPAGLEIDRR